MNRIMYVAQYTSYSSFSKELEEQLDFFLAVLLDETCHVLLKVTRNVVCG